MSLMEDDFPTGWAGWGLGFQDDSPSVTYIVHFHSIMMTSTPTSDRRTLDLGGWGHLLPSIRAFESLDETVLLPEILSSTIFHTDASGELFTMPLMLGLNPSMPPCHTREKVKLLKSGAAESWPGTPPQPASRRVLNLTSFPPPHTPPSPTHPLPAKAES